MTIAAATKIENTISSLMVICYRVTAMSERPARTSRTAFIREGAVDDRAVSAVKGDALAPRRWVQALASQKDAGVGQLLVDSMLGMCSMMMAMAVAYLAIVWFAAKFVSFQLVTACRTIWS